MQNTQRIAEIFLDEHSVMRRTPRIEHECKVAIYDLIEKNTFDIAGQKGPFNLYLSTEDNRLVFNVHNTNEKPLTHFTLSVTPFRSIIKDYFMVCDAYFLAIKTQTVRQIEAIDVGRRSLHNEGAEMLIEHLKGKVGLDFDTARHLFTLVYVLHIRN